MLKVVIVALVGAVFFVSWYANDLRRLTRDYPSPGSFAGPRIEALVRFALAEYEAHCVVGANGQGLYLAPSDTATPMATWWRPGYHTIRKPLLIPWSALQYHPARLPLGPQQMRFDVTPLRVGLSPVSFFIPWKDAEPLLTRVGRQVPPGD